MPASTGTMLASITNGTRKLPSRLFIHAVQKWGKTSFAAQAPRPIFLCSRGEDGLMSLIDSGRLPPTPHFPEPIQTWIELQNAINELIVYDHSHKTFVLDTINGAERLATEHVIGSEFQGDYEKFADWGKAGQRLLPTMVELTTLLDRLRDKGMGIILLAHSVVKTVKNPEGLDYSRWEPPLVKETQEHLDRWCDAILYGAFETIVTSTDKRATKGKAQGGQQRIIQTEHHAAYNAGNRLGLPAEIECGASPAEAWQNFYACRTNGKK